MSVNKVILIGRLGKDPEIRYTPSGTAVTNLSLATSFKPKDGEEKTEWHRCVAFGKTAEICGQYLHKGSQVYIEGRLQTRDWEDKDGNKRFTTEVLVERMQMLGSRADREQVAAMSNGEESFNKLPNDGLDDVPF